MQQAYDTPYRIDKKNTTPPNASVSLTVPDGDCYRAAMAKKKRAPKKKKSSKKRAAPKRAKKVKRKKT